MILELPNEDQKKGENQKKRTFSETQQVRTTRRTLPFFWRQSKFKVYIGKSASCEDSQSGDRPQDVVVLGNEQNDKSDLVRMR